MIYRLQTQLRSLYNQITTLATKQDIERLDLGDQATQEQIDQLDSRVSALEHRPPDPPLDNPNNRVEMLVQGYEEGTQISILTEESSNDTYYLEFPDWTYTNIYYRFNLKLNNIEYSIDFVENHYQQHDIIEKYIDIVPNKYRLWLADDCSLSILDVELTNIDNRVFVSLPFELLSVYTLNSTGITVTYDSPQTENGDYTQAKALPVVAATVTGTYRIANTEYQFQVDFDESKYSEDWGGWAVPLQFNDQQWLIWMPENGVFYTDSSGFIQSTFGFKDLVFTRRVVSTLNPSGGPIILA